MFNVCSGVGSLVEELGESGSSVQSRTFYTFIVNLMDVFVRQDLVSSTSKNILMTRSRQQYFDWVLEWVCQPHWLVEAHMPG